MHVLGHLSKAINLRGHLPRFTEHRIRHSEGYYQWDYNTSSCHVHCHLKPSEQCLFFQYNRYEVSYA